VRFDSLQQAAANRAARTRNSAGFGELADDLARQKGIAEAGQAQRNQLDFTNTASSTTDGCPAGPSGLFGVDSNLLAHGLGIPPELLNAARQCFAQQRWIFLFARLGAGRNPRFSPRRIPLIVPKRRA